MDTIPFAISIRKYLDNSPAMKVEERESHSKKIDKVKLLRSNKKIIWIRKTLTLSTHVEICWQEKNLLMSSFQEVIYKH